MTDIAETDEVRLFLGKHLPFSKLDERTLLRISRHCRISYHRRNSLITKAGDKNGHLSIVRSGAVELRLGGTELNARLAEGECFGYPSLIRGGPAQNEVIALEDTLLYRLEAEAFLELRAQDDEFRNFFDINESGRLRRAVSAMKSGASAGPSAGEDFQSHAAIESLARRSAVVTASAEMTIADAARLMAGADVSTLPVFSEGALVGIITDKDLRRRVLAPEIETSLPVSEVMTPSPIVAAEGTSVLTALIMMAERQIHHLPIINALGEVVAVVSSNDILASFGSNSLMIAKEVAAASDYPSVARAAAKLPHALAGLVRVGVDADHVSRYVSTIGEGVHRRLVELAEMALGPPPVEYALVSFGSLARFEQALGSDQDNGFIFDEKYDPVRHDAYFEELARRLSDGLDGAGYRYCPGEIMATNPAYRRTSTDWKAHFRQWIDSPDPQAILESTIFFDMRCLSGQASLVEDLRTEVFEAARQNRIFHSFVARAAAVTRVPLGFFRNFLLQYDSDEGQVLDLKTQAIAPVVDLARVHALASGLPATNTLDRLRGASEAGTLDEGAAMDLVAAFEFIRDVRLRHQVDQIARGEMPTNKLDPKQLSRFDREHLRDAFRLIRQQLDKLRADFAGGLM